MDLNVLVFRTVQEGCQRASSNQESCVSKRRIRCRIQLPAASISAERRKYHAAAGTENR
jgi:hypothetical protein